MENQELLESIAELTKEIGKLPKGYISKNTIAGKVYYYQHERSCRSSFAV